MALSALISAVLNAQEDMIKVSGNQCIVSITDNQHTRSCSIQSDCCGVFRHNLSCVYRISHLNSRKNFHANPQSDAMFMFHSFLSTTCVMCTRHLLVSSFSPLRKIFDFDNENVCMFWNDINIPQHWCIMSVQHGSHHTPWAKLQTELRKQSVALKISTSPFPMKLGLWSRCGSDGTRISTYLSAKRLLIQNPW